MPTLQTMARDQNGHTRLRFEGPLDIGSTPAIWNEATAAARAATGELTIDVEKVTICDGVGLGLLAELDCLARAGGGSSRLEGGSPDLQELVRMAQLDPSLLTPPRRDTGIVSEVGSAVAEHVEVGGNLVSFLGSVVATMPLAIVGLRPARVQEIVRTAVRVGYDAVPVVSFLGLLIGFILGVQALNALEKVGTTSLVPMVVGFATFREFGALIAAIILAGRSGSAFAAELGTMKISEELDAYRTFALDPMIVLVFPRIVAATLVMPLLALFSIAMAIVGGSIPMLQEGYGFSSYLDGVFNSVAPMDLMQALVKATVFGALVGGLGCFQGMRTTGGPNGVGVSTTRAVVTGIVAVLLADSIISQIFYSLGL